MRRYGPLSLLTLITLAGLGCAPGRVADLQDSGRMGIGLGLGLSVDARLGDLSHPALGLVSASAMMGFESRDIDGSWYEARVSDPYALYWYRREEKSWGHAFLYSGWRGTWESLDWLDALFEIDDPIDKEPLPETGTIVGGELLDGKVTASRWVPIQGPSDDASPLFSFNTATDLQLGAHLLLINARLGFNPLEFFDFLLGLGGLDIAGDDPTD